MMSGGDTMPPFSIAFVKGWRRSLMLLSALEGIRANNIPLADVCPTFKDSWTRRRPYNMSPVDHEIFVYFCHDFHESKPLVPGISSSSVLRGSSSEEPEGCRLGQSRYLVLKISAVSNLMQKNVSGQSCIWESHDFHNPDDFDFITELKKWIPVSPNQLCLRYHLFPCSHAASSKCIQFSPPIGDFAEKWRGIGHGVLHCILPAKHVLLHLFPWFSTKFNAIFLSND